MIQVFESALGCRGRTRQHRVIDLGILVYELVEGLAVALREGDKGLDKLLGGQCLSARDFGDDARIHEGRWRAGPCPRSGRRRFRRGRSGAGAGAGSLTGDVSAA